MNSKLDYPCKDYTEYEEIKKKLEKEGYNLVNDKNQGNYLDDPSIYKDVILKLENKGDMNAIRKEKQFQNQVEEMEWYWDQGGYKIKKVQGFNKDKKPVPGLVTFFVKNALDDIIISDEDEPKPASLPKSKSQEDILADRFFSDEDKKD